MASPLRLTIVRFALRGAKSDIPDNVAVIISDFLIEDMPLDRACHLSRVGSLDLLNFVWKRGLQRVKSNYWTVAKLVHTEPHYYRWEFNRVLLQAIRRGDFTMVNWVLTKFSDCPVSEKVVEEAAQMGHLWALQLLEEDHRTIHWSSWSLHEAAKAGHWDLVKWLQKRLLRMGGVQLGRFDLVKFAVMQNKLEIVQWLIANGFQVGYLTGLECSETEWQGRAEVLRYLLDGRHGDVEHVAGEALQQAARVGDFHFAQWLVSRYMGTEDGFRCLQQASGLSLKTATKYGHLDFLQWLLHHIHDLGLRYSLADIMLEAVTSGSLEVVRWLYGTYGDDREVCLFEKQPPRTSMRSDLAPSTAMDVAAKKCHLEVVQFPHLQDRQQHQYLCKNSTDLDNGRYPRRIGAAIDVAAESGHLEVVKWLHANRSDGCTTDAMDRATANGHLDVVQWLNENRTEGCTTAAMDGAAKNGNLTMLQWLHSNTTAKCTHKEMDVAAALGRLDIVRWLHENRSEGCTVAAMDDAASNGHLEIVKWLHTNRSEGCSAMAMEKAAGNGHVNVVKWLHLNRSEGVMETAVREAAGQGHLRLARWIFSNWREGRVIPAFHLALQNKQFETALFLHSQGHNEYGDCNHQEIQRIKSSLKLWNRNCHDICAWIEENYSMGFDQESMQSIDDNNIWGKSWLS